MWRILWEALEFFTVSSSKGRTQSGDVGNCQAHHQSMPNQTLFFCKLFKKYIGYNIFITAFLKA